MEAEAEGEGEAEVRREQRTIPRPSAMLGPPLRPTTVSRDCQTALSVRPPLLALHRPYVSVSQTAPTAPSAAVLLCLCLSPSPAPSSHTTRPTAPPRLFPSGYVPGVQAVAEASAVPVAVRQVRCV